MNAAGGVNTSKLYGCAEAAPPDDVRRTPASAADADAWCDALAARGPQVPGGGVVQDLDVAVYICHLANLADSCKEPLCGERVSIRTLGRAARRLSTSSLRETFW